jgi:hypothetical protein
MQSKVEYLNRALSSKSKIEQVVSQMNLSTHHSFTRSSTPIHPYTHNLGRMHLHTRGQPSRVLWHVYLPRNKSNRKQFLLTLFLVGFIPPHC